MKKNLPVCALALIASLAAHGGERPRNVLLITLDTTRADRLGCYGNKDGLTPNIDALAAGGVVFENAVVPIPLTAPSHVSIFTGLYPYRHGVYHNGVVPRQKLTTMAELFKAAGYRTAAFAGAKQLLLEDYVRGFETVDKDFKGFSRPAADVTDKVLEYLKQAPLERPCFIWAHYFDPHFPYLPPRNFRDDPAPEKTKALRVSLAWQGLEGNDFYYLDHLPPDERELLLYFFKERTLNLSKFLASRGGELDQGPAVRWYGGEIKYVDGELGRLFDYLDASGLKKDTLVIIVADHGETLLLPDGTPHFNHGTYLQDREVRVPLIFFDGRAEYRPRRVRPQVRAFDILPTALDVAGVPVPAGLDGVSLKRSLRGRKQPPSRAIFSHTIAKDKESVRTDRWKLIYDVFTEKVELYDLSNDPDEQADAAGRAPDEAKSLLKDLKDWITMRNASGQDGEIDPKMIDALKALGYLK